jgi:hypothetical protein
MVDNCPEHIGIRVGLDSVAEIEDVPGMTIVVRKHRRRHPESAVALPARTKAGSRLPCTTRSSPMRRRASVIDVRQSSPTIVGPGGVHRLEQVVAPDAEVDAGSLGMSGCELD